MSSVIKINVNTCFPEMFTFLSDSSTSVALASGSELATATIQLKNDVSSSNYVKCIAYCYVINVVVN